MLCRTDRESGSTLAAEVTRGQIAGRVTFRENLGFMAKKKKILGLQGRYLDLVVLGHEIMWIQC